MGLRSMQVWQSVMRLGVRAKRLSVGARAKGKAEKQGQGSHDTGHTGPRVRASGHLWSRQQ